MDAEAERRPDVRIQVTGLSVYTHHGLSDAEQELGQRLEIDVALELAAEARRSDRLEDTVDYAEVCELAVQAATAQQCRTLERVGQLVAERLAERFRCDRVTVRVAKPEPPLATPVESVAVTVALP